MEQIRKFLQGKGFALVLAACLLAAAGLVLLLRKLAQPVRRRR